MSEEMVSSEDIQFYEYLGLLEQAYYDTHVGSKAGDIIIETIKSYVNILKYKNNKLQQKVEQLENENFNIRENIHLERISLPPELTKDKNFMELYDILSYEDLQQRVEQLENIRKEAIESLEEQMLRYLNESNYKLNIFDLRKTIDILNKGSESNE